MGVLNVTPDSFSDGGRFDRPDAALDHAAQMVAQGVDILDVGGESTRPGAEPVGVEQELDRVVPLVEKLTARFDVPVSVDTSKPQVMRASVAAGARMINDVMALRVPGALEAVADCGVSVCLMHMQGQPRTMQQNPDYADVLGDVADFLRQRVQECIDGGIGAEAIALDPGFGFGKTLQHNLTLLARLDELSELGYPLLVGMSRKSMLGALTDRAVDQRLAGSLAVAALAAQKGAAIVRAHDVAETLDVLGVVAAVASASSAASG